MLRDDSPVDMDLFDKTKQGLAIRTSKRFVKVKLVDVTNGSVRMSTIRAII